MTYKDLDEQELVEEIRKKWADSKAGLEEWRDLAREDFNFRAGHQWLQEDIDKLKAQKRPAVTFDRIGAMIDAVRGLEVSNRQEVRYYPREEGDQQVNQDLTAGAKWVRDNCYAEDEESDAFDDAATCGIGCTETRMSYEEDEEGAILIERKDPLHMFWDPVSRKRCLEDAKYVFNAEWMHKDDVTALWPDKEPELTDEMLDESKTHNADRQFFYKDKEEASEERKKDEMLVLHYQCFKLEPFYKVLDPFDQQTKSISKDAFDGLKKKLKKFGMKFVRAKNFAGAQNEVPYVEQKKRVYYRAFLVGQTLLEYGESPSQHGFTFKFITARRDRNKKMFYGLVRPMKDPQRWGNKFFSMSLDIVASNVKGGAFVEETALVDKSKAEADWAANAPLLMLTEGSIDKIKERTASPYPSGFDKLMMFAFDALPYVSGLNMEAMGLADRAQAGVVERQRKEAAISLLAPLFDSLRRYRKSQGKLLLEYMQEFISDGRLMRVLGQTGDPRYLPLAKQKDTIVYDVVVDQAPTSPDYKEKVWESFKELLPVMMKQGYPIPPVVFDYTPLPTHVAAQMKAYAEGYIPPAIQEQMQQLQQQAQQAAEVAQDYEKRFNELAADKSVDYMKVQAHVLDIKKRDEGKQREAMKDIAVERIRADAVKGEGALDRGLRAAEIETKAKVDLTKDRRKGANA